MPNNGAQAAPPPVPNPPAADKPKPAPAPKPVEQPVENVKSKLNPQDTAALDNLFSELDGNFKTSYDLSQITSQVLKLLQSA